MKKKLIFKKVLINTFVLFASVFAMDRVDAAEKACVYYDQSIDVSSYTFNDENGNKIDTSAPIIITIDYGENLEGPASFDFRISGGKKLSKIINNQNSKQYEISSEAKSEISVPDIGDIACPTITRINSISGSNRTYIYAKKNGGIYKEKCGLEDYKCVDFEGNYGNTLFETVKINGFEKNYEKFIKRNEKYDASNTKICSYGFINNEDKSPIIEFDIFSLKVLENKLVHYSDLVLDDSIGKTNSNCPKLMRLQNNIHYDNKSYSLGRVTNDKSETENTIVLGLILGNSNRKNEKCRYGTLADFVGKAYNFLKFLVPIIIIALSTVSFLTVVISGENDKMEKAKKDFIIRLIAGILVLFVPFVLETILKLSGILGPNEGISSVVCDILK